jgi:hypothetical protein
MQKANSMYRAFLLFWIVASITLPWSLRPAQSQALNEPVYIPVVRRDVQLAPSNDLPVAAASYLGGTGSDALNAVDVAPDQTIVVGGTLPGYTRAGLTPVNLLGGGNGAIVRLSSDGRSLLSITRIGATVEDLEISANGSIAVCGSFGIAVLSANAGSVLWSANPGAASRCAIGNDGTTAALLSGVAHLYRSNGSSLGTWSIGGSAQSDIAIDAGSQSAIATGYTQVDGTLQVAFMSAWSYSTGALKWRSYGFSQAEVRGAALGADTRGMRVALGRDGKLYFAATINGGTGASIFSRDPKNINLRLDASRSISTDSYNTPSNVGSVKITWYGRFNPADGTLEKGQTILTRLGSGAGNSIVPRAITADEAGNVYIAGDTAFAIQNRSARSIGGVNVGSYELGEAFLLVVSADLRQRIIWTPFTGTMSAGGSPATGVAARRGTIVTTITLSKGNLITRNAFQPNPATLPDGYLAVWQQQ